MSRTVVITGASSGFGAAIVDAFAADGWNVAATMRNLAKAPEHFATNERVLVQHLDVTDPDSIQRAVEEATSKFGPVDAIVNAAGYTQLGTLEELSVDAVRDLFETNFFGLLAATKAVLPQMRERGSGHIINFSSLAGLTGLPGVSFYSASKWAVEGFSEGLSRDLEHLGVAVTIIEPGLFDTELGSSAKMVEHPVAAYHTEDSATRRQWFDPRQGSLPGAARAIVDVANSPQPPLRLFVGHGLEDVRGYTAERLRQWEQTEEITRGTLA